MQKGARPGRPLKIKSGAEMARRINAYFNDCKGRPLLDRDGNQVTGKDGKPVMLDEEPPTVTGLALALGLGSRQALLNYQGRGAYKTLIREAKLRIECYNEKRLFDREGVQGAKFNLANNFHWTPDQGTTVNVGIGRTDEDIMAEVARRLEKDEDEFEEKTHGGD